MSHNIVGSVGLKAPEFDNNYVLHLSEPFTVQKLTLSREKKGGSTASQKCMSLALQWAVPSVCSFVWVWDSSSFQNRRRNGGGG